jgi:hypothetical protein
MPSHVAPPLLEVAVLVDVSLVDVVSEVDVASVELAPFPAPEPSVELADSDWQPPRPAPTRRAEQATPAARMVRPVRFITCLRKTGAVNDRLSRPGFASASPSRARDA